jgi:hypothetical protein
MPIEVGRTLLTLPGLPQDKKMVAMLAARAPLTSQMLDMPTVLKTFGWHTTHNSWQDMLKAAAVLIVVIGGRGLLCTGIEHAVTDASSPSSSLRYAPSENLPASTAVPAAELPPELALLRSEACGRPNAGANLDCQELIVIESTLSSGKCDRELAGFKLSLHDSPIVQRAHMAARPLALRNCQASASSGRTP